MEKQLAELTRNVTPEVRRELSELFELYEVARLGDEVQNARINELYDKTLSENEFYAAADECRMGVNKGDRIFSHEYDFLLSKNDFNRLLYLAGKKLEAAGICDKNGYYLENWTIKMINAKNDLIDFIIKNIVPEDFRKLFWEHRRNVVKMDKLLEITKPLAA